MISKYDHSMPKGKKKWENKGSIFFVGGNFLRPSGNAGSHHSTARYTQWTVMRT